MAHVLAKHAAIREDQARQAAVVTRVVTDMGNDPDLTALALAKTKLTMASFSRAQEFEADGIGVGISAKAQFDPYGASRFLTAMERNAALKAGKHVLVEKAISLTPQDADAMLAAAKSAGKLLMVAHVLPFFPEYKFAAEAIRGGQYGKFVAAHFKRVIAKPDWSADIGDAAKTGGPAVDLHIHDTHFIGLVCGVPRQVFAVGTLEGDAVTYLTDAATVTGHILYVDGGAHFGRW